MNEAPLSKLLSTVVDNRGRTCPVAERGFPLIATNCVKSDHLYPVFEKLRFVDDETYSKWFRGHPKPGDLIFVLKGSPGEVCLTPDPVPFCIAQDMVALRADPQKINPSYLFAFLRSQIARDAILNMHVGTMIPHFKKGDFDKLIVPLPDERTQEFIGNWYITVSKKIELNRRINETLEVLAQTLFKDWFVDFGPARRKQEGATDPVVILGGLMPDDTKARPIAALFPDSFGEKGLPEGWETQSVGDVLELAYGKALTASKRSAGAVPVYGSGGITGTHDTPLVKGPGIVIGRKGTVGSRYWEQSEFYPIDTVFFVRPKNDLPLEYIWEVLSSLPLDQMNTDAAVPGLNRNNVYRLEIPKPPGDLIEELRLFAEPVRARIEHNKKENRTLAETRDYLLPKLMSGTIRVRDAEKAVS